MNVVDSSAWLEYFANGSNASFFARAIARTEELLVPSLVLYEVFKRVLQQRDEGPALQAARISLERKLPMADSVILATAQAYGATVWTQDADFKGLPGVQYRRY